MRNLKKFLALVLATLMVVSAAATVSAFDDVAEDNQYAAAIDKLVEYGITNGVDESNFAPDNDVERYQMALFMARALKPGETDWSNGMEIFDDVEGYYGAIAFAYTEGIVTGIGNNLFAPHDGIRYQDALIMALRALGYEVDVTGDPYWLAAYTKASEIGLTKNVAVTKGEKTLTRAETAQVIYNMLKAVPADGGATIEEKNFGVAGANNVTTFVITATEKQAYSDSAKAAEAGYVGVQTLVNGIPSGDIVYLPVAVFGFEAAEADNYFGYAFDFVNYDAKTGAFDKVVPGLEPVVAYNKDISDKNTTANKFKFDGVTYYAADAITGAALKNEIVIFNGGAKGVSPKMLLTNKDGNIVNYNGEVLATFAYETATGAKYYAYQDVTLGTTKVISEAAALEKFGVAVDNDSYIEYQTLGVSDLTGNYQVKFFDDDRDGKYERAVVAEVYASAFNAKDGDGTESFGPMADDKGVSYVDDATKEKVALTKGQIFTYTYNKQTKVVSVLDILEAKYGTLTRVNTTKNNGDNTYNVTLTIDGETYTLGNLARENAGITGAKIYNKASDASYDKVTSEAKLNYIYDVEGISKLQVGSLIKFYAFDNNTIITAKSYKIDEVYDRVVLKEITSYDSDAVYVDLYLNGKLLTDVAVSVINKQVISELNVFQYSKLLGDQDLFATGNVFRAVKLADGSYQLSEYLEANKRDSLEAFKLTTKAYDQLLTFDDGIMDIGTAGTLTPAERDVFIRTKDTTVFYFLKYDPQTKEIKAVSTYVGAPDNSTIDCRDRDVAIFADKIGYGTGDYNGVASFVLVYYVNASDIKGFGVANVEYNTAYIFGSGAVAAYDYASAADLGLVGTEYAGKYYYAYSVTGINMANAAKITTVYSDKALTAGEFYKLSADNVIIGVASDILSVNVNKNNFMQNRYYVITGVTDTYADANKLTTVKLTNSSGYDVKTDDAKAVLGDSTMTVKFIRDFEDGSFVGVAFAPEVKPIEGNVTITVNAKYTSGSATYAANYDGAVKDGKASGKITATTVTFTKWDDTVTGAQAKFTNKVGDNVVTYSLRSINGSADNLDKYVFAATANANGQLEINLSKVKASAIDTDALAKGNYVVTIGNSVNADTYEISFIVD